MVLLSVSLTRESVPAFARILMRTSLGKKHLVRPLLRTEITQVVNRRAWYDATKLTTDVLSLYKVCFLFLFKAKLQHISCKFSKSIALIIFPIKTAEILCQVELLIIIP